MTNKNDTKKTAPKKKLVISSGDAASLKKKLGNGDLSKVHGGRASLPTPVDAA